MKTYKCLSLMALGLVSMGALSSCGLGKAEPETVVEDESVAVRTQPITRQTLSRTMQYTATLEANEQVFYAPTLAGSRIKKINVEVGDHITKGQVLVEMDNNTLSQQELQLKNLETEYNRAVKLMETGSISQQNYDQVVTQYNVLKTAIANLKENTRMLAPFNGIVTGRFMEEGELYSGGAFGGASKPAIICIEEIKPMKAKVNISEQYYTEIKKGMKVNLVTDIYGASRVFVGTVSIVYPSIDVRSRTFSVELKFDNPDEALRPGMYGTITFEMGKAEALVVPSLAVLKIQGSNDRYIFIDNGGVAKRVSVKIVSRFDDQVEIRATDYDLKEGDKIVSVGQAKLVDGSKLKVVE